MARFNGTNFQLRQEAVNRWHGFAGRAPVKVEPLDDSDLQCTLPATTNFDIVSSFRIQNGNPAFCFKSRRTGLQAAVIRTCDGPLIKTFVTIPTPYHPDDLLPKVVEAVIHCGSESYPWNGAVSDIGTPRLLHCSESAATAEETLHMFATLSASALDIILPIFMDHLLYPLMSDSAFLSKVYHTDANGDDAGDVYLAAEGDQTLFGQPNHLVLRRATKRLLLVGGSCHPSDHHGVVWGKEHYLNRLRDPGLRQNEAIPFHREHYRPDNMYVVVCGHVNPEQVIASLEQVELSILEKRASRHGSVQEASLIRNPASNSANTSRRSSNKVAPGGEEMRVNFDIQPHSNAESTRPHSGAWSTRLKSCFNCGNGTSAYSEEQRMPEHDSCNISFPTENVERDVHFPAEEDEVANRGTVEISWLGPSWTTNADEYVALPLLMDYLLQDGRYNRKVSLMRIISAEEPTAEKWDCEANWVNVEECNIFTLSFHGVALPTLVDVAALVSNAIETLTPDKFGHGDDDSSKELTQNLSDFMRMGWRFFWERAGDRYSAMRLTKLLESGNAGNPENFSMILNEEYAMETLKSRDAAWWISLVHKYLGKDKPRIVVRGWPSVELKEKEAADKEERARSRRELGEDGLRHLAEILEAAEDDLERRRPKDLDNIPMPNVDDIFVDIARGYSNFQMSRTDGTATSDAEGEATSELPSVSPYFNLDKLPLRAIFHNISIFQFHFYLVMDTTGMEPRLRKYLPLFLKVITKAPLRYPPGIRWAGEIRSDGEEEPKEEAELLETDENAEGTVEDEREEVAVNKVVVDEDGFEYVPYQVVQRQGSCLVLESMGLSLSIYASFPAPSYDRYAFCKTQVETEKYSDGVRWLRDILFFADFADSRCLEFVGQQALSLTRQASAWRSEEDYIHNIVTAGSIVRELCLALIYRKDSNRWITSRIAQEKFLKALASRLETSPSEQQDEAGVDVENTAEGEDQEDAEDGEESNQAADDATFTFDTSVLNEIADTLRELQAFLHQHMDQLVFHVIGNFKGLSETTGDSHLEKPWEEILLPHCTSTVNVKEQLPLHTDIAEQLPRRMSKGKTETASNTEHVHGYILHIDDEGTDFGGSQHAICRQGVSVDFDPWADVEEHVALTILVKYLSDHRENLHLEEALSLENSEDKLAYRVSLEWSPNERLLFLSCTADSVQRLPEAYITIRDVFRDVLSRETSEDVESINAAKQEFISTCLTQITDNAIFTAEYCAVAPFRGITLENFVRRSLKKVLSLTWGEMVARAGKHVLRLFDSKEVICAVAFDENLEARQVAKKFENSIGLKLRPFESFEEFLSSDACPTI